MKNDIITQQNAVDELYAHGKVCLTASKMAKIDSKYRPFLALELRRFSGSAKSDAKELFKRMVFNALISNTDDHPRNHAFIAKNANDWHLSPAYDLTPTTPVSIERRDLALECGKYGRFANKYNLTSEAERFLLTKDEALGIIDEMYKTISQSWYKVARSAGVSDKIKTAFCYEGFNYNIK